MSVKEMWAAGTMETIGVLGCADEDQCIIGVGRRGTS